MNASLLRSAVKRAGHKPVNIRLVDGTRIQVRHPENVTVSTPHENDNVGFVIVWEGDEAPYLFDLESVAVISRAKNGTRSS